MDHPDTPQRALDLADRIPKTLTEALAVEERKIFTSASICVVPSLEGYEDPDAMLRDADTAMYASKEAGRARFRVFDQRMRHEAMSALELENDLWQAVGAIEFTAHYGPVLRRLDRRVVGLAALLGW